MSVFGGSEKEMVICFPIRDELVLLGERKKPDRPWQGKLSGFGGKVEGQNTPEEAMAIELREEAGIFIVPEQLEKRAEIEIFFPEDKFVLHCYLLRDYKGRSKKTKEANPYEFDVRSLPFEKMVPGDYLWVPALFFGPPFGAVMKRKNLETILSFEFTSFGKF